MAQEYTVEQLNHGRKVWDFMRWDYWAFGISGFLLIVSIAIIGVRGFNWGLDFTGGTVIEITLEKPVDLDQMRDSLQKAGFEEPQVQNFGSSRDIMVRMPPVHDANGSQELGSKVVTVINESTSQNAAVKRIEFVGPSVGADLAQTGALALIAALVCILIYVGFRFEWRLAAGVVIAFVGLVALRSPGNKLLTGTLKPILGYLMLSAGAGVIVANLNPLGGIIEAGFNIRGVIPNNEAIVSVAQKMLGVETMSILLLGFIFNLIIARCTKYKYIFLTGHHSFFLACLFSAVLQAAEFQGWMLILIGGFLLGSWSAISPAIGQRYTRQVTEDGGIAMGHFGSLGYYLSAWIASRTGNPANSFADTEISEKWGFLRDTTVTTGIVMFVIYFVCSAVAGSAYLSTITDQNMLIFSVLTGLQFAVGVAIV